MKKISFYIPPISYDEQGKQILEKLCKAMCGKSYSKPKRKKKNDRKKE